MQFEYTITLEDFREANAGKSSAKKPARPSQSLQTWLPLFFICILLALPGRLMMGSGSRGLFAQDLPLQNLWVTIAPSLCMTTFLTTPMMTRTWNAFRSRRAKAAGKSVKPNPTLGNLLLYPSLLWIIPAIYPGMAINWAPTVGQMLWAAFAPWPAWFALVGFSAARRKRRAVDETWEKRPTLHRTHRTEVTSDGVVTDDGVISHRIKWAYYKRYGETKNLLLLIDENDLTSFIAKRAVPEGPAMDELRMLISENIKEGSFINSAKAFPVILPVLEMPQGE